MQLVDALRRRAIEESAHFEAKDVTKTLWAFTTLNEDPSEELVERLRDRAMADCDGLGSQDVSNLLWAFVTLDVDPGAALLIRYEHV